MSSEMVDLSRGIDEYENGIFNREQSLLGGIAEFYAERSVLVTGATGFVGKTVVEKLLRSCPDVKRVYVIIRPKYGCSFESRSECFMKNPIFERLNKERPNVLKEKLRAISGDIALPDLGIKPEDLQILKSEVAVVLHTAATVKFVEPLKVAVQMNTHGTKRLMELCKKLPKMESFVHVSTAFSNADKSDIKEQVYDIPDDPDTVIQLVENMPDHLLSHLEPALIGNHPNTYTYTKLLAETVVSKEATTFSAAIIRPSIVTAAWQEPSPGWVDNVNGITGFCAEIGRGAVRSIPCGHNMHANVVPVDIVANLILAVAAHIYWHRPNHVPVYNCTSSHNNNPLLWKDLLEHVLDASKTLPSKYVQLYPACTANVSSFIHGFHSIVFHLVPAVVTDVFLRLKGIKPIMTNIYGRTRNAMNNGKYFTTREWAFECEAVHKLTRTVSREDLQRFPVDVRDINWATYFYTYIRGIRHFILKDDLSSLPQAKVKLQKLYWSRQIFITLLFLMLLYGAKKFALVYGILSKNP